MDWWLSPEIIEWDSFLQSWSSAEKESIRRPYAHWVHAERILSLAETEFHLSDVVTTLKRAVDHRLRLLNDCYKWKRLPVQGLPKGQLQLLEFLGVARHMMIARLVEIRNRIEHADQSPPSVQACTELVEFVWYFLKSTDGLLFRIPTNIQLEEKAGLPDSPGVELQMGPDVNWAIKVRGQLARGMLTQAMHDGWLRLKPERVETRAEFIGRSKHLDENILEYHRLRNSDDLLFSGNIVGPSDRVMDLVRLYFSAI